MSSYAFTAATLASLVSVVAGHGFITSPKPRMPGTAMAAACGQQVFSNQNSDNYGNVQGELQVASSQSDYNAAECDIWLCKGYKYADNTANVQTYTAGQVVPIVVDIRAPHTGVANVSVVDTATNTVIGDALKSWDVYASNASPIPSDEENFSITMPDVSSKCGTAGACVIQWYWNAASIDQTYEACIDFTMGGSGSPAPSASSSVVPSSTVAASSAPATSAPASSSAASSSVAASSAVSSQAAVVSTSAAPSSTSVAATSVAAVATSATSSYVAPSVTSLPAVITSAIPALSSAIPSEILTSALPTGTVVPAASNGTTPAGLKPLPAGTTIQDLLDWIAYVLGMMFEEREGAESHRQNRRHARDVKFAA